MSDQVQPIIIKKKKVSHGGHHGGAWKVAYADFVTAMMALFIVLWLMNTSKKVQEAVGGYFKDPQGQGKLSGNGVPGNAKSEEEDEDLEGMKDKLVERIKALNEFKEIEGQVKLSVTSEGLLVELLETEKGMFFELGSPKASTKGEAVLKSMAAELGKAPNKICIDGYTDAKPYNGEAHYSNWELSADRANSTRRLMQNAGVRHDQVEQIRGHGDQKLLKPDDPENPSNRRVSILVRFLDKPKGEKQEGDKKEEGKKEGEHKADGKAAHGDNKGHAAPAAKPKAAH